MSTLTNEVLRCLLRSDDGGYSFDGAALAALRAKAVALKTGEEIFALLRDLLSLASYLEQVKNAPHAARSLAPIVETLYARLEAVADADLSATAKAELAALRFAAPVPTTTMLAQPTPDVPSLRSGASRAVLVEQILAAGTHPRTKAALIAQLAQAKVELSDLIEAAPSCAVELVEKLGSSLHDDEQAELIGWLVVHNELSPELPRAASALLFEAVLRRAVDRAKRLVDAALAAGASAELITSWCDDPAVAAMVK